MLAFADRGITRHSGIAIAVAVAVAIAVAVAMAIAVALAHWSYICVT